MERIVKKSSTIVSLLQSLLAGYLLTGGALLLLALLLYRFHLSEAVVTVSIIIIYIISTFLAGFITGRKIGNKKFLWGLAVGISYFLVMLLISLFVNHQIEDTGSGLLTTILLCGGAGMLGGMLS